MVKVTASALAEVQKALDQYKDEMDEQFVRLHMGIG
jgi:hypothetical protein